MRPRRERSARPFSKWLLRLVFACLVTQDGDARGSWGQPAFIRPRVLFQVCCHLAFVRGWSEQFAAFALRAKVRVLVAPKNACLEQKAVRTLIPKSGSIFDANKMIL